MKKALPVIKNLGLLLAVILLTVTPASAQEPDQDFTILLKSRQFVPAPGMDKAVAAQLSASSTGRSHVLIQFDHIPTAGEREALEGAGVKLLAYVPHNAWFASVPATVSLSDKALASARWLGSILPQDKLRAGLWEGQVGPWAVNADGSVSLDVLFFADVPLNEARQIIVAHGGHIEGELPEFHRLRVRAPGQAIATLAGEDGVQWVAEVPPPKVPLNDGSRARTNVDNVQAAPYNLSGSGVDLGIWDEGKVDAHVDFCGRLTVVDSVSTSYHATHVAGTMAGDGANSAAQGGSPYQWKGMAPGADIISYDWYDNISEHNGAINTYGIELSQNSWSLWIDENLFNNCSLYGDYDFYAPDYDQIVTGLYGKRIVVAFAAGNERNDCDCGMSCTSPYINYGNIPPPGTAKNVITLGATNSNDDSMTYFSSWGPVDDGRIKPDVVAPGCESGGGIKSTFPGNTYGTYCGTSMAAPAVSGISGLLIQQYRSIYGGADPWPSTVKALLIHTAVDLDDATSYYNPGPDYASGYGRVDAQAAADVLRARDLRQDSVSNGATDTYTITVPAGAASVKVTLVWDDPAGAVNANPAPVNDLDLTLVEPYGFTTHLPWVLDPANPS
ncbi:MAG TPA: peptidase S8, partial [Anaerolineae bacterium]|nr:peptidase S8 [Anaerolineae bacterium]